MTTKSVGSRAHRIPSVGQGDLPRKPQRGSARAVGVLWCGNARSGRSNGWAFPPAVNRHLRELTKGKRVCHLFGGLATFGLRCDIDPVVRPDVYADAWLPPFKKDAFDIVILDPPYLTINQQMKNSLLRGAAYIASESVIWFHTMWIASDSHCQLSQSWLVRVGDSCAVRCLQVFRTPTTKPRPRMYFTRGPAMKYNRWLAGQTGLPFGQPASVAASDPHADSTGKLTPRVETSSSTSKKRRRPLVGMPVR